MPKLWTAPFVHLTAAHLLQGLGYSSMPLLPLYLAHTGADRGEIGQIMACAAVGGLLFRPLVAWALDFWGRRRTLVAGTVVLVSSLLLIGTVTGPNFEAYASRFLFGMGGGALFSGYFAFASDIIPASRRTEGLAIFGIFGLIPLGVNPIVGRALCEDADLRFYFPAMGLLILFSLLFLWKMPHEKSQNEKGGDIRLGSVLKALLARPLWSLWCAVIPFASLVTLFIAFATVTAESIGVEHPAWIWGMYGAGAIGVRAVGARLPDKLGPHNIVAPALAAYGVACVLMSTGSSQLEIMLAGALAGMGHGYCFPVLVSQVVTRISPQLRGSSMAMFTALWELAAVASLPAFGSYADAFSDQSMFALAALFALVGLVAWAILEHGQKGRVAPEMVSVAQGNP